MRNVSKEFGTLVMQMSEEKKPIISIISALIKEVTFRFCSIALDKVLTWKFLIKNSFLLSFQAGDHLLVYSDLIG